MNNQLNFGFFSLRDGAGCTSMSIHLANYLADVDGRVALKEEVLPGQEPAFTFTVPPDENGEYIFHHVHVVPSDGERVHLREPVIITDIGAVGLLYEFAHYDKLYLCTDGRESDRTWLAEYKADHPRFTTDVLLFGASRETLRQWTAEGYKVTLIGDKKEPCIPQNFAVSLSPFLRVHGQTPPVYHPDMTYEPIPFAGTDASAELEEEIAKANAPKKKGLFGRSPKKEKEKDVPKKERKTKEPKKQEEPKPAPKPAPAPVEDIPAPSVKKDEPKAEPKTESYSFVSVPAPQKRHESAMKAASETHELPKKPLDKEAGATASVRRETKHDTYVNVPVPKPKKRNAPKSLCPSEASASFGRNGSPIEDGTDTTTHPSSTGLKPEQPKKEAPAPAPVEEEVHAPSVKKEAPSVRPSASIGLPHDDTSTEEERPKSEKKPKVERKPKAKATKQKPVKEITERKPKEHKSLFGFLERKPKQPVLSAPAEEPSAGPWHAVHEANVRFEDVKPSKDLSNYVCLTFGPNLYFGKASHIDRRQYRNDDGSLVQFNADVPKDELLQFFTQDLLSGEFQLLPFSDKETEAMTVYFSFLVDLLGKEIGKTADVSEFLTFKDYYNRLVEMKFFLEEEQNERALKAHSFAQKAREYADLYGKEPNGTESDLIKNNGAPFLSMLSAIEQEHMVNDDAKTSLELLIDDIREFTGLPRLHTADEEPGPDASVEAALAQTSASGLTGPVPLVTAPLPSSLPAAQAPTGILVPDDSTDVPDELYDARLSIICLNENGEQVEKGTYAGQNYKRACMSFLKKRAVTKNLCLMRGQGQELLFRASADGSIVPIDVSNDPVLSACQRTLAMELIKAH